MKKILISIFLAFLSFLPLNASVISQAEITALFNPGPHHAKTPVIFDSRDSYHLSLDSHFGYHFQQPFLVFKGMSLDGGIFYQNCFHRDPIHYIDFFVRFGLTMDFWKFYIRNHFVSIANGPFYDETEEKYRLPWVSFDDPANRALFGYTPAFQLVAGGESTFLRFEYYFPFAFGDSLRGVRLYYQMPVGERQIFSIDYQLQEIPNVYAQFNKQLIFLLSLRNEVIKDTFDWNINGGFYGLQIDRSGINELAFSLGFSVTYHIASLFPQTAEKSKPMVTDYFRREWNQTD